MTPTSSHTCDNCVLPTSRPAYPNATARSDTMDEFGMDREWPGSDEEDVPEEYDSDRLSDTSDWDEDPPAPDVPQPPLQIQETRNLWVRLRQTNANYREKVLKILYTMNIEGMNLPIFLQLLCWGDDACINDAKIRYERTGLMVSEELPHILAAMREPPRSSTSQSHASRPAGASKALNKLAVETIGW